MTETKLRHALFAIVLAFGQITAGAIFAGCGHGAAADGKSSPSVENPPGRNGSGSQTFVSSRVSDRPANPGGKVFVAEYHHIRLGKNAMFRSPDEFRQDLERLDKDGFRPCTVSQYLDDKMNLPPGASPVVFTFDDATPSQIRFLANGSLDPTCAVGIWEDFAKTHPDFPVRATFYVLPDSMWGQPKWRAKKVALVKELGCELGNHTVTHPILKRLSDEQVKWEIGEATDDLEKLGTPLPVSLALPFGVSPKNKALLQSFDYKGKKYEMKAVMLVGAEPARAPSDPKFNRYRIPRIQAYNGPSSLSEWLDKFEAGKVKVYVAP